MNLTIWWVWVGGFFQVTPSNFTLFVSFMRILSKFSYVEPNPYYRLYCELGVLCYLTYRNLWRWYRHTNWQTEDRWWRSDSFRYQHFDIHIYTPIHQSYIENTTFIDLIRNKLTLIEVPFHWALCWLDRCWSWFFFGREHCSRCHICMTHPLPIRFAKFSSNINQVQNK